MPLAPIPILRHGMTRHALRPFPKYAHLAAQLRFLSRDSSSEKSKSSAETEKVDRSKFTEEIKVYMPDMGEGEGRILKWYKKEGDFVERDEILCDIETKDFSFGMVTDDNCDAIMGKILVPENSEPVKDNSVICTLFHPHDADEEEEEKK